MSFFGVSGLVELPSAPGWDPRSGDIIHRRWRGTPTEIAAAKASLRTAGIRYQVEPTDDGGYQVIGAYYGAEDTQPPGEPLSDQWTLDGNDIEKSLWELPAVRAELDKILITNYRDPIQLALMAGLHELRPMMEAYARGEQKWTQPNGTEVDLTVGYIYGFVMTIGLDPAVLMPLLLSLTKGVESYTVSQWVLKHTLVIAANSTIKPSKTNIGKMYATASLIEAESIPNTLRFDLPDGYWLKRTPTVDQTAADKWTISQEWWHADAYDPFIYQEAQ